MKLYIKYMVSLRCKMMVKELLRNKDLHCTTMDSGTVEIEEDLTKKETLQLKEDLRKAGLELMDGPKIILIEKIKSIVIEMVYYCDEFPKQDCAEYISEKLNQDYLYLEGVFSEVRGITINQFIINHKIERIKELILYDDLSLHQISEHLCYDSVSALSQQFEQFTGLTLSYFMELKQKRKRYLEST